MKRSFNIIVPKLVFALILLSSCATYKNKLRVGTGNIDQARMNVIIDFAHTYKTPKRYLKERQGKPFNVFDVVREESLNDGMYLLSLLPNNETISMHVEDKIGEIPRGYFPNRYIVEEHKLFLWNDGATPLQIDVLEIMDKFGVLDSTDVKIELGLFPDDFEDTRMIIIDDRLESYNYFICKTDVSEYKKVVTYKAFGSYEPPNLNCNTTGQHFYKNP